MRQILVSLFSVISLVSGSAYAGAPLAIDLAMSKPDLSQIAVGEVVSYDLIYGNSGEESFANFNMTVEYSSSLELIKATSDTLKCEDDTVAHIVSCTKEKLAYQESETFQLYFRGHSEGSVTPLVQAHADSDSGIVDAKAEAAGPLLVQSQLALLLSKPTEALVSPGQTVDYSVSFANLGQTDLQGLELIIDYSQHLAIVKIGDTASLDCTKNDPDAHTLYCSLDTLAAAQDSLFQIRFVALSAGEVAPLATASAKNKNGDIVTAQAEAQGPLSIIHAGDFALAVESAEEMIVGQKGAIVLSVSRDKVDSDVSIARIAYAPPEGWTPASEASVCAEDASKFCFEVEVKAGATELLTIYVVASEATKSEHTFTLVLRDQDIENNQDSVTVSAKEVTDTTDTTDTTDPTGTTDPTDITDPTGTTDPTETPTVAVETPIVVIEEPAAGEAFGAGSVASSPDTPSAQDNQDALEQEAPQDAQQAARKAAGCAQASEPTELAALFAAMLFIRAIRRKKS